MTRVSMATTAFSAFCSGFCFALALAALIDGRFMPAGLVGLFWGVVNAAVAIVRLAANR